jgi:hypothetical protein
VGKSLIEDARRSVHIRFSRQLFCVGNFPGEWDHPSARRAAIGAAFPADTRSMFSRPNS